MGVSDKSSGHLYETLFRLVWMRLVCRLCGSIETFVRVRKCLGLRTRLLTGMTIKLCLFRWGRGRVSP